ncbi:MAG: hypothetical protein P4M13_09330 [Alphaproteobacteria bacterium]|nr:hypothetical protein [Alphaproteobacteria bacterium]
MLDIVLVEADSMFCELMSVGLKAAGFDVRCAENLPDTLELLKAKSVDMIISGGFYDGGGAEALIGSFENSIRPPIVIITGYLSQMENIPTDIPVLRKPCDVDDVLLEISNLFPDREEIKTLGPKPGGHIV